jgi:hypothetical protein
VWRLDNVVVGPSAPRRGSVPMLKPFVAMFSGPIWEPAHPEHAVAIAECDAAV